MATPKILLTAFEPFGNIRENASSLCLKKLKESLDFSKLNIKTNIYPVTWAGAKTKLLKDLTGKYDYLIHLGQHDAAEGVLLESTAYNRANSTDADGIRMNGKINETGAAAYRTLLDRDALLRLVPKKKALCLPSDDAGRYLCNYVYYLSMQGCAAAGKGKCLFIHIPIDPSQIAGTRLSNKTYDVNKSALAVGLILQELAHK